MQTGDFLRAILPSQGWYYVSRRIQTRDAKGKSIWIWANDAHDTVDALESAILSYDAQGIDTYYAMAGFAQASYQKTSPSGRARTKTRTQENAAHLKAFWLDIDCGASKPYATQRDALTAIKPHFGAQGAIPRPTYFVSSGYGLHLYWVLDRDLDVESWTRVATALKQLVVHVGIESDAQLIADSARVLRPIGTHNHKDPHHPRAVELLPLKSAPIYTVKAFALAIFRQARAAGLDQVAQRRTVASGLHTLAGRILHRAHQPFSAEAMATQCPAFQEMRDTRGKGQSYPHWLCCVQTLVHAQESVDDNALIHAWSAGYEDYDEAYVEDKIELVREDGMRPVRCETMAVHASACATCPHRGRINSPVRLGWQTPGHVTEKATIVEPEIAGMKARQFAIPPLPPAFAGRFRWDGQYLLGTRVSYDKQGREVRRWEVPITPFFFMVDFIFQHDDIDGGDMMFRMSARIKQDNWRSADLPMAAVGRGGSAALGELARSLGLVTPRNPDLLEEYVKTWIESTTQTSDLQSVCRTWGWHDDGSFVLGGRVYRPDGSVDPAMVSKGLARQADAYKPKGNLERYVELINDLYNRPDRTAHQIIWMSSFASVLARLYDVAPLGLVVSAVSNISGSGKTSAVHAAMGVWSNPYDPRCMASAEGITEFAIYRMAGDRKHLPMGMDETTRWTAEKLMNFLYRYAQGTPKVLGSSDGGLRDISDLDWLNILLLTTNSSASAKIIAQNGNAAPMVARILEIPFPEEDLRASDKNGLEKIKELLREHTGLAGHAYIEKLITTDKSAIQQTIRKLVAKINEDLSAPSSDRYWVLAAALLLVAFSITRHLGLHSFDKREFKDAVYGAVRRMRSIVEDAVEDVEDILGAMMADMNAGLIVTLTPGQANRREDHNLLKPLPRGRVQGRIITTGEKAGIYILAKDVRLWCNDHQKDYNELRRRLEQQDLLIDHGARFNLGLGTPLSTGRPRSWHIRYDALQQVAQSRLQLVASGGQLLTAFDGDADDDEPLDRTEPVCEPA